MSMKVWIAQAYEPGDRDHNLIQGVWESRDALEAYANTPGRGWLKECTWSEHQIMIGQWTEGGSSDGTPSPTEADMRNQFDRAGSLSPQVNDCPYTHSHTRHWCGYDGCRES